MAGIETCQHGSKRPLQRDCCRGGGTVNAWPYDSGHVSVKRARLETSAGGICLLKGCTSCVRKDVQVQSQPFHTQLGTRERALVKILSPALNLLLAKGSSLSREGKHYQYQGCCKDDGKDYVERYPHVVLLVLGLINWLSYHSNKKEKLPR